MRSRSSWTATAAGRARAALTVADGHRAGSRALRPVVETAIDLGVESLVVYAFSTENWTRSGDEVGALMEIFAETIERELDDLAAQGVRTRFVGRRDRAPEWLQRADGGARARDRRQGRASASGSRSTTAAAPSSSRPRAGSSRAASRPDEIDEEALARNLYAPEMPDPDLVIRTSGRAAHLELPALAVRLRGVRLHRDALARLRARASSAPRSRSTRSRRRRFGGR